ncbi:hypothetical protein, partial [Helicobacter pylori]|uniref:hypothetical protein n=1 Tax=Helicobacter pylori TaxID=210 RepID=UPI000EAF2149
MHTSYARYKCMRVLYYKLAAFIPNTKDVWDFCLGGLNPCLIDVNSFLTKGIKLPKKLDFRSYVMILSFILSLQILFY